LPSSGLASSTTKIPTVRVLVVGAGVAGLTLRRALADTGIDVIVAEARPGLEKEGAGLTLWPNATNRLDTLGVTEQLLPSAARLVEGQIFDPAGQRLATVSLEGIAENAEFPVLGVRRSELLQSLVGNDAAGIHFNRRVQQVRQNADSVVAVFDTGDEIEADLLVGADGISSAVRSLTIGGEKRYAGYVGLQGAAPISTPASARGISQWTMGPGSTFGVIPAGPSHIYFFGTLTWPQQSINELTRPLELLRERFASWHDPLPWLLARVPDKSIIKTPIYDRPPSQSWTQGRVTLIGDAVHGLTPTFGQGACLAIESAVSLADHLLMEQGSLAELLQRHETARIRRTRPIVRTSRIVGQSLQLKSSRLTAVRNLAVRAMPDSLQRLSLDRIVGPGMPTS